MNLRPEGETQVALAWANLSPKARQGWEQFARRLDLDPVDATTLFLAHIEELLPADVVDEIVADARRLDQRRQN